MTNYKNLNNIIGWIIGIFATAVYGVSMEPTASFWDCGEFISGAYKLQVVHPPGAPLFLMIGRIFSLFASGTDTVAAMVNFSSALSTGMTILFLFWTITALAKKIMVDGEGNLSMANGWAVLASGVVGSLACLFSDTVWFSAVEGEVYAMSLFSTAVVFWAILKWEAEADQPHADRWILLIAFVIGLSIGVHLLNLLTIPAIAMVYYFKRFKTTRMGVIKAFLAGGVVLGAVQFVIIPGTPLLAAHFDKFFVNSLSMPFWSGMTFFVLLLIGLITFGLKYAVKHHKHTLHTALLSLSFLMVGYSSYAMVLIRSNANPSIDMSDPADLFNLLSYLNREQYGDTPLLKGPYFTSTATSSVDGAMKYYKGEEKYEELGRKPKYKYDKEYFFPRIHDWRDKNHVKFYRNWLGLKKNEKPDFADNIKFFFTYQIGFMYWRYFLWNFAGRQNDIQGHRSIKQGNWLTGLPFIDDTRLAPDQQHAPENKINKGFNRFYLLPFILGLFGMIFHFQRTKKDASVVLLLFFFTGLAIILFLNQPPQQPRERDYAYAGSIYTFCIWIGMCVLAFYEMLKEGHWKQLSKYGLGFAISMIVLFVGGFFSNNSIGYNGQTFIMVVLYMAGMFGLVSAILISLHSVLRSDIVRIGLVFIACMSVPMLMATENWNDHSRANTYTARDFAVNYLESCAPNAILFTQGDNDTYPLWYAQEVEGVRTDIRIVNLSLLGVDWYIDKLHEKINDADRVKLTLKPEKYRGSNRDYVPYYDDKKYAKDRYYDLQKVVQFIASDDRRTKVTAQGGDQINYYPVKNLRIPVDKQKVLANGTVSRNDSAKILPAIEWKIKKGGLYKNDLMVLDILASNNWERPVYFAISVSPSAYMGLQPFFQLEGLTYRIVPYKNTGSQGQPGKVNSEIMYANIMNKFRWGGIDKGDIYLNENNIRMTMNLRNNFARLAEELIKEGKPDKAKQALERCLEVLPHENVPYNLYMLRMVELFYDVNGKDSAQHISKLIAANYEEDLNYYFSLPEDSFKPFKKDTQQAMAIIQELVRIAQSNKDAEFTKEIQEKFNELQAKYVQIAG